MASYLMGIDNGLTVSKAAILDLEGREVAVQGHKVEMNYPRPAWVERDSEIVWQTTAAAIREVIEKAGIDNRDIVGVGNSAHGNGIYLVDKAGAPLGPSVTSMDNRASDIIDEWFRPGGVHDQNFAMVLTNTFAAQPAALLAWFKRHRPEVWSRIGHAFPCKDYIKYRLTGTVTSDYTDMSGSSLYDSRNRRFSPELLDLYGIGDILPALPEPIESHDIAGRVTREAAAVTGLAEGTPVAGGMFDIDAAAVGAGVIDEGMLSIVAGTWSINQLVLRQPVVDSRIFMFTIFAVPGLWLATESSATSATNLEWFITHFCHEEQAAAAARGISVYEVCNEIVESLPPGGTDVIFHPFLYGSRMQANARAGFYGLGAWHTKAHVLRALYEGVVYGHLDHVNRLRATGAQMTVGRLTGGGARSSVWTQIFADALELPIEVPAASEIAALGAAIAAGIGVGVYAGYADAVAQAVQVVRRHEPQQDATDRYLARYEEYRCLQEAMREPWQRLEKLGC
ncbi:MAG: carbohydrate kinase [Anaerolineae bacterium]|mgnify:CR=1 FL=1|jgi:L-xylulokinase|nr:carbohydrate kinase [Anaerolineae bacterium]